MRRLLALAFLTAAVHAAAPGVARAQRPAEPEITVRGFADLGRESFLAADSFTAVLGSSRGTFFGAGGQVGWKRLLFEVAATRFKRTGERVFVSGGEVFPLGIPATIAMTPLEFSAFYRFAAVSGLRPYAGGGLGRLRYTETSDFADPDEDVSLSKTSYHLAGGAEVRISRGIAAAGEFRFRSVPGAIGEGGVSAEFGEDNLGGTSVHVRIIVGR